MNWKETIVRGLRQDTCGRLSLAYIRLKLIGHVPDHIHRVVDVGNNGIHSPKEVHDASQNILGIGLSCLYEVSQWLIGACGRTLLLDQEAKGLFENTLSQREEFRSTIMLTLSVHKKLAELSIRFSTSPANFRTEAVKRTTITWTVCPIYVRICGDI